MSEERFSEFQQLNVRHAELAQPLGLDLNYPPPGENMALADPLDGQVQGNGHAQGQATAAADFVDDEVVVISPRKFEEARNRQRSRRVMELYEGAEVFTSYSAMANWAAFNQRGAFNWEHSYHMDACNKAQGAATSIPVPRVVPQDESQPEGPPTFTCSICMGQLIEETTTKCGHIFCKECIETAILTQHKCPTCRRKLRRRDTFRVYLPNIS